MLSTVRSTCEGLTGAEGSVSKMAPSRAVGRKPRVLTTRTFPWDCLRVLMTRWRASPSKSDIRESKEKATVPFTSLSRKPGAVTLSTFYLLEVSSLALRGKRIRLDFLKEGVSKNFGDTW